MKLRLLSAALVFLVFGAIGFLYVSPTSLSLFGREVGGSALSYLAAETLVFLEDLQFKDFEKAATHHLSQEKSKKGEKRDIKALIKNKFKVDHEVLDITTFRVIEVDLDSSQSRARVRVNVTFRILGDTRLRDSSYNHREIELLFYWFKEDGGGWGMELR